MKSYLRKIACDHNTIVTRQTKIYETEVLSDKFFHPVEIQIFGFGSGLSGLGSKKSFVRAWKKQIFIYFCGKL